MYTEWKKKWVEALRSGKYQQTRQSLKRDHDGSCGYCCLGVLCDLVDPDGWGGFKNLHHRGDSNYPTEFILAEVGLSETDANFLATQNDKRRSFKTLADLIEKEDY